MSRVVVRGVRGASVKLGKGVGRPACSKVKQREKPDRSLLLPCWVGVSKVVARHLSIKRTRREHPRF